MLCWSSTLLINYKKALNCFYSSGGGVICPLWRHRPTVAPHSPLLIEVGRIFDELFRRSNINFANRFPVQIFVASAQTLKPLSLTVTYFLKYRGSGKSVTLRRGFVTIKKPRKFSLISRTSLSA